MKYTQSGFSAVELLITLIIAVVFVGGASQLWSFTQRAGADADRQAKASNIAYEYLRRYSVSQNPCTASTPVSNQAVANSGINAFVTVSINCPYSGTTSVSRVTSTVTYFNNTKSVSHAIFVN